MNHFAKNNLGFYYMLSGNGHLFNHLLKSTVELITKDLNFFLYM